MVFTLASVDISIILTLLYLLGHPISVTTFRSFKQAIKQYRRFVALFYNSEFYLELERELHNS